ncbi:contractile injection system tape measure protein [uncultured Dokdonia sp.]|uniref:contractile injection system tape measure protein n=1 Tax=uncultured Dokdonia sp. TaxID=575653 RepID=UPI00260369ED|nr:contractile injection system tape measure protein [uncultured Dokdonia sp.]
MAEFNTISEEGLMVPNAGLVILNSYLPMLLARLDLVRDNVFVSEETQNDAVHYLQYLVTGLSQTEESLLVLNKVLCGLAIETPIRLGIEISTSDKELMEGLLTAAIGYWPAIGDTSIEGFRGNWLVRDGVLKEEADRWTLTVEKRSYDILMLKSPFSFSIIKFPWMEKPLHVTWSF